MGSAETVVEERRQRQQETRDENQREAILAALRMFPEGETPRVIREMAGVSGAVATRQLTTLIREGIVVECTIRKHTREERAVRLECGGTGGTVPPCPGSG